MDVKAKTKQITWISLLVNTITVIIKLIGGYFGHSQTVIADAIHSLSDSITDVAILIGVNYWQKPPDETHPYGHKKIETIVTTFIGLSLFSVAVGLCYNSIISIKERHTQTPTILALIVVLISIVSKEWLYRWTIKIGKLIKSPAVIANAYHHRSDVFSSIPAAIAVGTSLLLPNLYFIDHIGAIAVSVIIMQNAYSILKPTWFELVDAAASKDKIIEIQNLALNVDGVISVHALRTRYVGSTLYVDLHVQVDGEISVAKGYEIARLIKKTIYNKISDTVNMVVQIEPHNIS